MRNVLRHNCAALAIFHLFVFLHVIAVFGGLRVLFTRIQIFVQSFFSVLLNVNCLSTLDLLEHIVVFVNPLIATLKPQSNGLSLSNTVIGTLAVDGWAVTFGTARRGLGGAAARPGPSSLYQM